MRRNQAMHPDLQMLIEVCEQGLIFSLAVMAVFVEFPHNSF